MITDAMVEAGARAICAHTGDDPDQKTYAHEMKCTSHDREPVHRWQYWAPFARVVLASAFVGDQGDSIQAAIDADNGGRP